MIAGFLDKRVSVIKPASVATNGTATGSFSLLGFHAASIDVHLDSQTSTTSKPATLVLSAGDGTSYTAISTGGTDFTIPQAQTVANIFSWNVNGNGQKKNLKVTFTPGDAAQIISVTAREHRPDELPNSSSEAGCALLVTL